MHKIDGTNNIYTHCIKNSINRPKTIFDEKD